MGNAYAQCAGNCKGHLAPTVGQRASQGEDEFVESQNPRSFASSRVEGHVPGFTDGDAADLDFFSAAVMRDQDFMLQQRPAMDGANDWDIVHKLLYGKSGPSEFPSDGPPPLVIAAGAGHEDVAQYLLESRADLEAADELGRTSLFLAADAGHTAVVELLGQSGASFEAAVGVEQRTALHVAAARGKSDVVEALLRGRANIIAPTASGNTPLHIAACANDVEMCALLLQRRAEIEARVEDKGNGMSALIPCAQAGALECVLYLVNASAPLETADASGRTALIAAAVGGHELLVTRLIDSGSAIDAKDNDGLTALVHACKQGHSEVAEALITKGANDDACDENGTSARSILDGLKQRAKSHNMALERASWPLCGSCNANIDWTGDVKDQTVSFGRDSSRSVLMTSDAVLRD